LARFRVLRGISNEDDHDHGRRGRRHRHCRPGFGRQHLRPAGRDHRRYDKPDFDFNSPTNADLDSDGIVYGIGAGYDFAIGKTVALGIDVEASASTAGFTQTFGTDSVQFEAGRDLYAGLRFTAAASERLNLYAKAGYTNARVGATLTTPTFAEAIEGEPDGGRVGLGAQFLIGKSAHIGAEYRYSNYEADFSRHQAVAALGLRF
jgi:outer membrane immunogenic protein